MLRNLRDSLNTKPKEEIPRCMGGRMILRVCLTTAASAVAGGDWPGVPDGLHSGLKTGNGPVQYAQELTG